MAKTNETKNDKMISHRDILTINALLNTCENKGLTVETLLAIIDYKDELATIIERYQKAFKEITGEYKLEVNKKGNYDWSEHPKSKEIGEKINALLETEVEVHKGRFMDMEDFMKILEGMKIGDVSYLKKYMVKP